VTDPSDFAADLHLACNITCGPRASARFAGTALRIDSRAVTLKLPRIPKPPKLSEMLTLEIPFFNPSKCLRIRGWVTRITTLTNGERYLEVRIRTAVFRSVNGGHRTQA
jgi:hypothetical protein